MSRRISFEPKILPIIFDIWPPMITVQWPLRTLVATSGSVGNVNNHWESAPVSCSVGMQLEGEKFGKAELLLAVGPMIH